MSIELEPAHVPTQQRARFAVTAEQLGRYQIDVPLPVDYSSSTRDYPVIVVLDANDRFEAVHASSTGSAS
ncbi:hypothetical protein [Marmoricola sp. RAF53]|uniref:hypothetical protein n=1 Tax=Marmoricola sp. RAF53 TaxID=3233059 RepID=UPI003F96F44D